MPTLPRVVGGMAVHSLRERGNNGGDPTKGSVQTVQNVRITGARVTPGDSLFRARSDKFLPLDWPNGKIFAWVVFCFFVCCSVQQAGTTLPLFLFSTLRPARRPRAETIVIHW